MSFHLAHGFAGRTASQNRGDKQRLVLEGRAHAALVYDGSAAVGWCQFGPTAQLPRIKNRQAYLKGLVEPPDWRITCFFVDREHRGRGIASAALKGALREISRQGGGTVESYPEEAEGRSTSASFLPNGTVAMFERMGFTCSRRLGKNHWVVVKVVRKSSGKETSAISRESSGGSAR